MVQVRSSHAVWFSRKKGRRKLAACAPTARAAEILKQENHKACELQTCTIVQRSDVEAFKNLTKMWTKTVIVLTFANVLAAIKKGSVQ